MEHAEKSLLDYITTFKGSLLDSKDLSSLIEVRFMPFLFEFCIVSLWHTLIYNTRRKTQKFETY